MGAELVPEEPEAWREGGLDDEPESLEDPPPESVDPESDEAFESVVEEALSADWAASSLALDLLFLASVE